MWQLAVEIHCVWVYLWNIIWRTYRIQVPDLYSIKFHGKLSTENRTWKFYVDKNMKIPWRLHKNHVEYSMELPWDTTGLHGVFVYFCPRRITMEKVFRGNFMEYISHGISWSLHGKHFSFLRGHKYIKLHWDPSCSMVIPLSIPRGIPWSLHGVFMFLST